MMISLKGAYKYALGGVLIFTLLIPAGFALADTPEPTETVGVTETVAVTDTPEVTETVEVTETPPVTETPVPACPEGTVGGTVISFDPDTGETVLELSDGTQCTKTYDLSTVNPVALMLSQYFHQDLDLINMYHEDGMGYGVLVKLLALSDANSVPVDQLVNEFKAGTGMGKLFQTYGKPSLLGVGHVKKGLKNTPEPTIAPSETVTSTLSVLGPLAMPTGTPHGHQGKGKNNTGNSSNTGNSHGGPKKTKTPKPPKH